MTAEPLPPILPETAKDKSSIVLPPQFKGGSPVFTFLEPRGNWRVSIGEHVFKAWDLCHPDRTYRVEVLMLCGSEVFDALECSPMYPMTAVEFARRTQVVASIQHVTRRACATCLRAYREGLSPDEKRWLYSTVPTMGAAHGFDGAQFLADLDDGKVALKPMEEKPYAPPRTYKMPALATRAGNLADRSDRSGRL